MNSRLLSLLCWLWLGAACPVPAGEVLNFNPDWRFVRADAAGAEAPGFDDAAWQAVSAPHSFNDVDTFDDFSGGKHEGETKQWSGRTWYRKSFAAPAAWRGRKVFIEFEGVRQVAEVYLNGKLLGRSENGFVPFGFDLTPLLQAGGRNVLAVMCDNRFVADVAGKQKWGVDEGGSRFPWNNPHWHPAHGGIYRNVRLHVADPLHVTLPLYSNLQTVGAYVFTPAVSRDQAEIGAEVEIANETAAVREVQWRGEVLDPDGRPVLEMTATARLEAGAKGIFRGSGKLAKPRLWDPESPQLYTLRSHVLGGGVETDVQETTFGIRYWKFTRDEGLLLNGRHLRLHGWGQKSTDEWPGLASALPDWLHFETLRLMREAGGNFVRWGHVAGGPAEIAAANRLGIITLQPGVDGESDCEGRAWVVRAAAFRDVLVRYRNDPAIFIWEGGNQDVSAAHVSELHGYVEQFDPKGGRAYAHRRPGPGCLSKLDLEIGTQGSHKYPQLPVVEGEYDREEAPRRVWDAFSPPDFGYKVTGRQEYVLTSEQFAVNQVKEYVGRLLSQGGAHNGGANWIFSDSTSGGRNTAEVTRASGEVDAVRLPKDAYFVCQAMFRDEPQVHLIGHWTYPADRETVKTLFVVSNCAKVELLVNGRSLGIAAVPTDRFLFAFPQIKWEAGKVEVRGLDVAGKPLVSQVKETVGPAVRLRLTPVAGPGGWHADGADVVLVDVEAVDAQGRRHPTIQQRVDFEMAGPAVWRGGYNSGKEGSTNLTHLDLEAGINRIALRATREAGKIILKASSQGLAGAELVLEAKPAVGENGVIPLPPPSAVPEWLRGPGKFLDTPPGPKLAPPGKGGNEIDRVFIDGKGNDHGMA